MQQGRCKLEDYHVQLEETVKKRRDDRGSFEEKQYIQALDEHFAELEEAIKSGLKTETGDDRPIPLLQKREIKLAIGKLVETAGDLHSQILKRIGDVLHEGNHYYQTCLWIVGTTSVCGVLLMAGLLRFFYGWVFYSVRDLEAGAERVAHGDFAHRMDVHSGDEMDELAQACNNMTHRTQEMLSGLDHQVYAP